MSYRGCNCSVAEIDSVATLGLAGVDDSLSYRIAEVERHMHSNESWYGLAVAPALPAHAADRIGTAVAGLVMDGGGGGGGSWGTWIPVLGSTDTPARAGMAYFDLHRLFITGVERAATVHFIQFGFGASGAAALAAGTYTEFVYRSGAAINREAPVDFQTRRHASGTLAWARCWAIGADTGTLTFFVGLHEYEG